MMTRAAEQSAVDLHDRFGNAGVRRLIQRKATVSSPSDPSEHEAEALANLLLDGGCAGCAHGRPCANCAARMAHRRASSAGSTDRMVPDDAIARLRDGHPLDPAVRLSIQQELSQDFSDVRVHVDGAAGHLARSVNADAFTFGTDVVFAEGRYRPDTTEGRRLIVHELVHVAQQRTTATPAIQRQTTGPGAMSITPEYAARLDERTLAAQVFTLRQTLLRGPDRPDTDALRANLAVLEAEEARRQPMASTGAPTFAGTVPRPPGLPTDQSYVLQPLPNLPPDLVARLPEGQLVTLPAEVVAAGGSGGRLGQVDIGTTALGSGSNAALSAINVELMQTGFRAAGPNAIGLVAMPRPLTPGALMPESSVIWGHTAIYARVNGRIVLVRGFNPRMNPEGIYRILTRSGEIRAGQTGTPAAIGEDAWLFTKTSARSLEFPVTEQTAQALINRLPPSGPAGAGVPPEYTASPAAFEPGVCTGTNCVQWAVDQLETTLGTEGNAAVLARGRQGVSVIDLGDEGTIVKNTASQGRLIRLMSDVEAGEPLVEMPGALGSGVAGRMATGLQVIKWGGRAMMVVAVGMAVYEVYEAPPGQRLRTGFMAGGGLLGGFLVGALAASLICGPAAPLCALLIGIGFGALGAYAGREFGAGLYDIGAGLSPSALLYPGGYTSPYSLAGSGLYLPSGY